MRKIDWGQLRKDIGGNWFLNRTSYLLVLPFVILSSVMSSGVQASANMPGSLEGFARYSGLFFANIFSLLVCWAYFEVVSRTLFRNKNKKPIGIVWVLVFGASVGALKGATTGVFSYTLGVEPLLLEAITNRVFQTTLLGIWLIPALSLVLASLERYRNEREILISERVQQALRSKDHPPEEVSLKELHQFVETTKRQLTQIRNQVPNNEQAKVLATELKEIIELNLRPLSHNIWERESKKVNKFSLRDLLMVAITTKPFPLTIVLIGYLLGFLPILLNVFSFSGALVSAGASGLIIVLLFSIGKALRFKTFGLSAGWFVLINVLTAIALSLSTDFLFGSLPGYQSGSSILPTLFWLAQLSLFGALLSAILDNRRVIQTQLTDLLGSEVLDSVVLAARSRASNREFAQYVHSNLQNKLLSSAIRLEQQQSSADVDLQIREIETLLDNAVSGFQPDTTESLQALLDQLETRWRGFVHLVIKNQLQEAQLSNRVQVSLVQLLNEAVSNAVRHGLATNMQINLSAKPEDSPSLEVAISDDGLGPRSGKPGLGVSLFTELAGSNWKISSRQDGGTELFLQIPMK